MNIIGLDIGGANVKAADSDGNAFTTAFAVWKSPERLAGALRELLARFVSYDGVAVTITAELADCFTTKAEGIDRILQSVDAAVDGRPVVVWQTAGEFVTPVVAREFPMLSAAANWHALATWCGRIAPESAGLLIDVGTTTTDIIPLEDGMPVARGLTDIERLLEGELVYTGVRRTPVCAIASSIPFRGRTLQPAAELFATAHDVYVLLGLLREEPENHDTANGRPATVECARDRLARMLCCDRSEISDNELQQMAEDLFEQQRCSIRDAIDRVLMSSEIETRHLILSGSGEFLARAVVDAHPTLNTVDRFRLSEMLTPECAEAACAFAVARLARERVAGFLKG